jgi:hypothetical protein
LETGQFAGAQGGKCVHGATIPHCLGTVAGQWGQ